MTAPHTYAADDPRSNQVHPSLEEVDVLVRQCHHLHDETIALAVTRLFGKIGELFGRRHVSGHRHPAK